MRRGPISGIFGPLYFLDGVMGLALGSGYLDLGIFLYGPLDLPLMIRFLANLPHLLIGGVAIWVGYRLGAPAPREEALEDPARFGRHRAVGRAGADRLCRDALHRAARRPRRRRRLPLRHARRARAPRRGADLAHLSRMVHRLFRRELRPLSRRRQPAERLSPMRATYRASGRACARSTGRARPPAAPATRK